MARGRLISKSLGSSRKFHALLGAGGKLGEFCQVLYPLLVTNTDDFGRMPGDAFTVKNVVLPSSPRPERDFDRALDVMADVGLIARYRDPNGGGGVFLQIHNFDEHQPNLHKRTKSKFPEYPGDSENYRANIRELNLTESKGTELNPEPRTHVRESDTLFDTFWAAYPKKKDKEKARRAWDRRRPNADLLAVMLAALERQKQTRDWQKSDGQFIPYPATWLNDARWTDDVEVDLADGGLSETARHNLSTDEDFLRIVEANELARTGTHGHRR